MQLTNNRTTIVLNEEKLLNLIIDQRIVKLEKIMAAHYHCDFNNVPKEAYHTHLYLCFVDLDLKQSEIADVYEISENELKRIIKACHVKMEINNNYKMYLLKFHLQLMNIKIAA